MPKTKTSDENVDNLKFEASSTKELVSKLFKNDYGQPFELTDTQWRIFSAIFTRGQSENKNRGHIMTYTQFGKSDVTAMAVLLRASTYPEKWAIIAPTQAKARIIMGYVIKHLFENEYTLNRFKVRKGENVESIRRERSKNRLTFNVGENLVGEIFILSAESRLKSDVGNSLMGFGAPNVVMDEAALISDDSDAKATRMVGGFSSDGGDFVCKIGNPFKRNHFYKAYESDDYFHINVDYRDGLKEKRLSQQFIDEMNGKPFFDVLYANRFPRADAIDEKGWTQLLTEEEVERAMTEEEQSHVGELRLGNDVARGGGDSNAWVLRSMNYAEILGKSESMNDLTEIASYTMLHMEERKVLPANTWVDMVGMGSGVVDNCRKEHKDVQAFNGGEKAIDLMRFANRRAEAYWRVRQWIRQGGKLQKNDDWYQLSQIKFKPDARGRVRLMSKDEMRSMGLDSPDICDALMMTFARGEHSETEAMQRRRERKRQRRMQGRGVSVTMGGYGS